MPKENNYIGRRSNIKPHVHIPRGVRPFQRGSKAKVHEGWIIINRSGIILIGLGYHFQGGDIFS